MFQHDNASVHNASSVTTSFAKVGLEDGQQSSNLNRSEH